MACVHKTVKSVETPTGTYTYTYDKLGNILNVTDGTYTTSYEYDSLNQLTRINDEKAGKTTTYSYTNGNITECNEYAYTTAELNVPLSTKTWTYDDSTWSDLLTNYNGTPITYDEIGNPLTIGEKSLTWTGRQLQGWEDEENSVSYSYNGDGLRTSKTVNGTKTEYYYNGSILAGQKTGDNTLVFMYDNNSDIFGFIYNDTEYYYVKNAQNDVIAIADADGNVLVKYFYDAWGKIISITKADGSDITDLENDLSQNILNISTGESTPVLDENGNPVTEASISVILARINPILYRSYYYDKETEWYYLKSRLYNPEFCKFINSDDSNLPTTNLNEFTDKNLFAYCDNNPIMRIDTDGHFWDIVFDVVSLGMSIADVAANPNDPWAWASLAGDVIDLAVPCVGGVGEVTKAIAKAQKADDVVDAAKAIKKFTKKSTGSYEILYKSGKNYVGKGGFERAIASAKRNAKKYNDVVTSIHWKSAPNRRTAFIDEYKRMKVRGVNNKNTYNKIWSPGRKYYISDFKKLFKR